MLNNLPLKAKRRRIVSLNQRKKKKKSQKVNHNRSRKEHKNQHLYSNQRKPQRKRKLISMLDQMMKMSKIRKKRKFNSNQKDLTKQERKKNKEIKKD
jgi:hypothetical protein